MDYLIGHIVLAIIAVLLVLTAVRLKGESFNSGDARIMFAYSLVPLLNVFFIIVALVFMCNIAVYGVVKNEK